MHRCIPSSKALGLEVIDLTPLVWDRSDEVAHRVIAALHKLTGRAGVVYVLDIFHFY